MVNDDLMQIKFNHKVIGVDNAEYLTVSYDMLEDILLQEIEGFFSFYKS